MYVKAHWLSIAIVGAMMSLLPPHAAATDVSACQGALVKSTYSSSSAVSLDWRLADLVDEDTYNAIKHDAGASGVIYGVPIGGSYSDFKESIESYKAEHKESLSFSTLQNIAWTGVDPNSETAYKECLDATIFTGTGLQAAVSGATPTNISIRIRWFVPESPAPLSISWSGTDPAILSSLPTEVPQGDMTVVILRPAAELLLSGNSGGFTTGEITLEPLPLPTEPYQKPVPEKPNGWYGFSCASNLDREKELHSIQPNFSRICPGTGTFDTLCQSIGKKCVNVVDWQNKGQACNANPNDGSRIAFCQK